MYAKSLLKEWNLNVVQGTFVTGNRQFLRAYQQRSKNWTTQQQHKKEENFVNESECKCKWIDYVVADNSKILTTIMVERHNRKRNKKIYK